MPKQTADISNLLSTEILPSDEPALSAAANLFSILANGARVVDEDGKPYGLFPDALRENCKFISLRFGFLATIAQIRGIGPDTGDTNDES